MATKSTGKKLFLLISAGGLALASCTLVKTHKNGTILMSETEFAKYVEDVFRYHNQVMNELIESSDENNGLAPEKAKALAAAEAKMIETCRPLNEVVAESLSGKQVGIDLEMTLSDTVPACEEASEAVDDLIP